MICKNCGMEVDGNFCKYCGASLPEEKPTTEEFNEDDYINAEYRACDEDGEDTIAQTQQKKVIKKVKKKKNRHSVVSAGKNAVSGAASTAGSLVGKSVKMLWNLLFTGLHWASVFCMAGITLLLLKYFWDNRYLYGPVSEIVANPEANQILFTGGALFLVLFGVIETLWTLSSKKVMDMGIVRNIDTGRGFFAFCIFFLLSILSPVLCDLIPSVIP
ncbi:MAG: hypothetical protein SPF99_07750, partial [Anaerobutyricum sp.]|nr:hypothetical protein [Anaerobutyricum sp.]